MPIKNEKGLAALRALSEGGSPGLQAYKQSQQAEQASRTTALQNALGGQDVAAAAAKAQAQYAPQIANAGLGIDNLNVAADNYLSRASNRLAAQKYEDQQNLTLQAESLRRKENELTQQERMQQLQGAADIMAQTQQGALQGTGLVEIANQRAKLQNDLNDALRLQAQTGQPVDPNTLQAAQAMGLTPGATPGATAPEGGALQFQADQRAGELAGLNPDEVRAQIAALDEQYKQQAGQYAGLLGRDTKGLEEALASGDARQVQGLIDFLRPEAERASRQVDVNTQERLRQLAPAFGIDELTAAGMFREGEGSDMQRLAQQGKEKAYIGGEMTPAERKALNNQQASDLGFASGTDYSRAKNVSGMSDEEIETTMQSEDWSEINEIANAFLLNDKEYKKTLPEDLRDGTGVKGFQEVLKEHIKGGYDVGANGEQIPWDDAKKAKLVKLATEYYNNQQSRAGGAGETSR